MVPKILEMVSEKRIKKRPGVDIFVAKGILRQGRLPVIAETNIGGVTRRHFPVRYFNIRMLHQ